ncbi:hypothetical protein DFJ63DRAFT_314113 [Scheffersomyces coipomensis]|uniref:uncharacterized protein n=1 Tax=Scheffersomyces coipomensis TaxID=1788519 RepID=UPI00315D296A
MNNNLPPPSKPRSNQGQGGSSNSNLGDSTNLLSHQSQPPPPPLPPHSSSSTSSIQHNNAGSSQSSRSDGPKSSSSNPSTIQSSSSSSAMAAAKRSNFQFTYDADNFLLDLIFKYKDELFTRGNTIKTWELVLYEFNHQFKANIVQSRTINNRFKILRKNLENRLMNETALPLQDLNLNENEKLLINLNQFLSNKELSKTTTNPTIGPSSSNNQTTVGSSGGNKSNSTNKFFDTNLNNSNSNNTKDSSLNYKFQSLSNTSTSSFVPHSPQESLDIDPTSTTSPSFNIQLSPTLTAETPSQLVQQQQQQQIQQIQQLQQLQQIQQQQPSQQFPFQFLPPKADISFENQPPPPPPPQVTVAPPPAPQQQPPPPPPPPPPQQQQQQAALPQDPQESDELRFRKRIKSIPTTSSTAALNQDLLHQLLLAQNEYNLQINEIRKEIQDLKYEFDYKIKDISNKIDLNNENLHLRLNNYFELMMTRLDIETTNLQQPPPPPIPQRQQQSQQFQSSVSLSQISHQQQHQDQLDHFQRSLSHQHNSPILSQQSQSTSQNHSQHQSPEQQHRQQSS